MKTAAKERKARHYRPRSGDLVTMSGKTYRISTPQMLCDFANVEAGRLDGWETLKAGSSVEDLMNALEA